MTALPASLALGSPEPGRRRGTVVALLVIVVATVLVYSNTFDASFHFDDASSIVNNEGVHDLSGPSPSSPRYLGELSFALDYRLHGLDVFGYHLANLLIHVCNGLFVFSLATLTLRTPVLSRADAGSLLRRHLPLAAALLFSLHPVQTQAVTYIVQRFASLATLFFVGSLVLYVKGRLALEEDGPPRVRAALFFGLSFLAAAAAMKTKEISFTLPFVAAGYELLFFRRPRWRWLLVAPLAAAALLVPLAVAPEAGSIPEALGQATRLASETGEVPTSVYLLTQSRVVVTYLRLLVLPVGQNLDYDFPLSRSPAEPGVLLALAILLAVAASAVALLVRARRSNRAAGVLVFFGLGWFFVTLSVESSVIPLRDVIFEHRMYLPSAGAAIALGTLVLWAVERMHLRTSLEVQCAAALLLTAGPLGLATYARNFVWRDEVTLWSDVVARSPSKARPHLNLGMAYWRSGRLEDAIHEYRETIRLGPEVPEAHYDLGLVHEAKGQLDDAIAEYREAILLDPAYARPHNNLGVLHQAKGQLDDAVRELREVIRLDPGSADPHTNLGVCYLLMGRVDEAIREQLEAVRLAPELAAAHNNLGSAYERAGRLDEATREYREALRLAPSFATARRNLRLIELK
ncbi:MAG TPA: tetratricopeptide repeat protein [Anaeromyxobacter sp.]